MESLRCSVHYSGIFIVRDVIFQNELMKLQDNLQGQINSVIQRVDEVRLFSLVYSLIKFDAG